MSKSGALILMYHHVSRAPLNPAVLNVHPSNFAEHLEVIRREAYPITLDALVERLESGRLPERAVALTFDDGYQDTLSEAQPLMERYDVPATVFVTTGGMDEQFEFWWDELERLLLLPGEVPTTIELHLPDQVLRVDMTGATVYKESALERDNTWRIWDDPPTPRHAVYQTLCSILKPLPSRDIHRVMDQLRTQVRPHIVCAARRLTFAELETVHKKGLIRVGSHTVTHPMLSTLSMAEQIQEIATARICLEEFLGARIKQFAYPYGDYTDATLKIVRGAGIEIACTTRIAGPRAGADPCQLPRYNVFDLGADEFAKWISRLWNTG